MSVLACGVCACVCGGVRGEVGGGYISLWRLIDVWSCCLSLQEPIAGTLSDPRTFCVCDVPGANLTGCRERKHLVQSHRVEGRWYKATESGRERKDSLVSSSRAAINISGWRVRAQAFTVNPFLLWWTCKSLCLHLPLPLSPTHTHKYIRMHSHDSEIQHTIVLSLFSKTHAT